MTFYPNEINLVNLSAYISNEKSLAGPSEFRIEHPIDCWRPNAVAGGDPGHQEVHRGRRLNSKKEVNKKIMYFVSLLYFCSGD